MRKAIKRLDKAMDQYMETVGGLTGAFDWYHEACDIARSDRPEFEKWVNLTRIGWTDSDGD